MDESKDSKWCRVCGISVKKEPFCNRSACKIARELSDIEYLFRNETSASTPKCVARSRSKGSKVDVYKGWTSQTRSLSHKDSDVKIVCILLMDQDSNFLMLQRADDKKWEFPGGLVMKNKYPNLWVQAIHHWTTKSRLPFPAIQNMVLYIDTPNNIRVYYARVLRKDDTLYEGALFASNTHVEAKMFRTKDNMFPKDLTDNTHLMMPHILQNSRWNEPHRGEIQSANSTRGDLLLQPPLNVDLMLSMSDDE